METESMGLKTNLIFTSTVQANTQATHVPGMSTETADKQEQTHSESPYGQICVVITLLPIK